jgi:DivIVA domain-containing protein
MALDRDSIVRRDFPTHRRGYDPAAVDAHLDELAGEVEALQRRAAEPATLSSQAGEQVRAIVQAAERGAQEIREAAAAEGREHVARVTEAAGRLRERIEQMERDVTQLMSDLRTDAARLRDDLAALHAGAGELSSADAAPAGAGTAAAGGAGATAEPAADEPPWPPPEEDEAAPATEPHSAAPATAPHTAATPPNGDAAAARIVALDMALSGTPRDETGRFLAEHYDVPDRESLLDEVYAAAGG